MVWVVINLQPNSYSAMKKKPFFFQTYWHVFVRNVLKTTIGRIVKHYFGRTYLIHEPKVYTKFLVTHCLTNHYHLFTYGQVWGPSLIRPPTFSNQYLRLVLYSNGGVKKSTCFKYSSSVVLCNTDYSVIYSVSIMTAKK